MAIRKRNDPVRLLGSRALLAGLFVLVALAGWGTWGAYQKDRESTALRTQAQVQLKDLSSQKTQLDSDIAILQTNRGKEALLRAQYALARAGEQEIIIVDPAASAPVQATSTFMDTLKKALWWW
jgi:hypothetical protein